jgi:thiol-disulfide isomerase/thioredoxin
MTGLLVLGGVLVVAAAIGLTVRRRAGALRAVQPRTVLSEADLGRALGTRATLVQFSSAFCRPCVATRRVLGAAADRVPGVAHVEVDAESNLELVRRLAISATPTTLVLDAAGVERLRARGVPRPHEVLAALGDVVG